MRWELLFSLPLRTTLSQVSMLFPVDRNPAERTNRISPAASQQPQPWQQALELFQGMARHAHVAVAHNASFDRSPVMGVRPGSEMDKVPVPSGLRFRMKKHPCSFRGLGSREGTCGILKAVPLSIHGPRN